MEITKLNKKFTHFGDKLNLASNDQSLAIKLFAVRIGTKALKWKNRLFNKSLKNWKTNSFWKPGMRKFFTS